MPVPSSTFICSVLVGMGLLGLGASLTASSSLDLGDGVILDLIAIPAGRFVSGESNLNRSDIGFFTPYERFAHKEEISRPFYAGKYLVTVAQFGRFVHATSYLTDAETGKRPWHGLTNGAYTIVEDRWTSAPTATWRNPGFSQDDTHPVTCISWYDANAFCEWASKQNRKKVRLPTERELEFLQRAGTETRFYWGAHPDHRGIWANVADDGVIGDEDVFESQQPVMKTWTRKGRNDGYPYTTPVGFFPPNLFGIYDAIGNVWEYTAEWDGNNPGKNNDNDSSANGFRSMKGGSWRSTPDFYRPSIRIRIEPESRTSTRGFRVVVEP